MADLATLQAWLTAAESAKQKLLIGSSAEEIEHADMRVRYTRSVTGLQMLDAYINDLKSQIAALGGPAGPRYRGIVLDL